EPSVRSGPVPNTRSGAGIPAEATVPHLRLSCPAGRVRREDRNGRDCWRSALACQVQTAQAVREARREAGMLNLKVVSQCVASFAVISFVLCIGYGLVAPAAFHSSWLLEAILPGFKWLTLGSFVLGLIESALYGGFAGALYSALYNYFARRAGRTG